MGGGILRGEHSSPLSPTSIKKGKGGNGGKGKGGESGVFNYQWEKGGLSMRKPYRVKKKIVLFLIINTRKLIQKQRGLGKFIMFYCYY